MLYLSRLIHLLVQKQAWNNFIPVRLSANLPRLLRYSNTKFAWVRQYSGSIKHYRWNALQPIFSKYSFSSFQYINDDLQSSLQLSGTIYMANLAFSHCTFLLHRRKAVLPADLELQLAWLKREILSDVGRGGRGAGRGRGRSRGGSRQTTLGETMVRGKKDTVPANYGMQLFCCTEILMKQSSEELIPCILTWLCNSWELEQNELCFFADAKHTIHHTRFPLCGYICSHSIGLPNLNASFVFNSLVCIAGW